MAKSKYEYVKEFESNEALLARTWTVFRLDGCSFSKLVHKMKWSKPVDPRGVQLMEKCCHRVMQRWKSDLILCYCNSDEASFLLRRDSTIHNRRKEKLLSMITSYFTSCFVLMYPNVFDLESSAVHLQELIPHFDGRIVTLPSRETVRDYFRWRQADTHINYLQNLCFWTVVQREGCSKKAAHQQVAGKNSSEKQEMLFTKYGINYNDTSLAYRRGSLLVPRKRNSTQPENTEVKHGNIMKDSWWTQIGDDLVRY